LGPHSEASEDVSIRLSDLAARLGGSLEGDGDLLITGIAGLEDATAGDISFCSDRRYRQFLATTKASAVIIGRNLDLPAGCRADLAIVRVENPYLAMGGTIGLLEPRYRPEPGVHETAVIAAGVELGKGVHVGARAVIGEDARVGARSSIGAGCVIASGVTMGSDCALYPNVTLYDGVVLGDRVIVHSGTVLGADGFGYAQHGGVHVKIPQVGGVVIEDDVEIGANSCVDRATLGVTRIGQGTKIDNMVQIGHNCQIGSHTIVCGQVGLSGTTKVGSGVMLGGQVGAAGHLTIGDGARVAGGTGVTNTVAAGVTVAGYPHQEISRWRRVNAALRRLPELVRRVSRLESTLGLGGEEDE
jgi:UDP-3-O-[3-hydroxymyristoyl] glucosamine N-acyltransferase